mmetsp:Transcript_7565/g.20114  ORF Transcript_7565/g.20114 Transcript_7565/m.20114 type:complete len:265 (-) Transcript_7565:132-926(-)
MQPRELVEKAFLHGSAQLHFHSTAMSLLHQRHGVFKQVANDLIDVTSVKANFGKLGGLNLDKRSVHELCEPSSNLRFSDAGWSDHQHVFRHHLVAQLFRKLLSSPPIAQSNRHRTLRVRLPHDEAVELCHYLTRRQLRKIPRRFSIVPVLDLRRTLRHAARFSTAACLVFRSGRYRSTEAPGSGHPVFALRAPAVVLPSAFRPRELHVRLRRGMFCRRSHILRAALSTLRARRGHERPRGPRLLPHLARPSRRNAAPSALPPRN